MVPLTSVLLEDLPPFVIAASRYTLALAVLACIIAARERAPILPLGLPWGRILLLGGGGIGCFATCYTFGIGYSGPIAAAAILATQPVVAVLMDWLVTRRRIGGRLAIAVVWPSQAGFWSPSAAATAKPPPPMAGRSFS
jgi:EamA-like transporter family.